MTDNVIKLDITRIDRNKPRKCTCDPLDLHFTIDTTNKEITCECGMTVDPFEALKYLAEHYERINNRQEQMDEQRREWLKEKPHSVMFKKLEREYQRGKMLPECPRCHQPFDYTEINGHINAEFYRRWKAKQAVREGKQ
ncbi:hypothetical protein ACPC37_34690 [Streptomyces griseoincarnatus]|uniref:hypothetical protein n=1 Tax=Paenibacillus glucanolyticus TaxID=59843 RepID=UPI0036BFFA05